MSDEIQIELKGDKDVRAAFQDLKDYLPKQAVRSAVRSAAELMLGFIALTAPKRTGQLIRNMAIKTKKTAGTIRARVVINTRGKRGDPGNAFYWRFLEKGWHTVRGGFHKFSFIAGVFEAQNRQAAQQVIDAVEKSIDRAERKAKRALGG